MAPVRVLVKLNFKDYHCPNISHWLYLELLIEKSKTRISLEFYTEIRVDDFESGTLDIVSVKC